MANGPTRVALDGTVQDPLSFKGADVKLLNLTKKVKDVLQVTKLYTVFDIYDDEASAIASFK